MNFSTIYDSKRNPMFNPMHHNIAKYCTEAMSKTDLQRDFGDELFLNNLHLIPDPLKKNLADTLITTEKASKPKPVPPEPEKMPPNQHSMNSKLSGITNFFSGVFGMLSGAMFRPKSPVYYDCFTSEDWQPSNLTRDKIGLNLSSENMNDGKTAVASCEDKLNQVKCLLTSQNSQKSSSGRVWLRKRPKKVFVEPGSVSDSFEDAFSPEDFVSVPNTPYIESYSPYQYQCEELYETGALKTKIESPSSRNGEKIENTDEKLTVNKLETDKTCLNMDRKCLNVEQVSVDKENIVVNNVEQLNSNLEPNTDVNQLSSNSEQRSKDSTVENLNSGIDNLKIEEIKPNLETTNSRKEQLNLNLEHDNLRKDLVIDTQKQVTKDVVDGTIDKNQLISSCEDKVLKLKALLDKRKQQKNAEPRHTKPQQTDKHFKNPNRTLDKRKKSKLKKAIQDDMVFANEIELDISDETPNSSPRTCLGDYFDEVTGRFRKNSITDSDDSFQIVFNDTPRVRLSSDCESEDSFIVFEDPDSCYTSNDVFGSGSNSSDSEMSDSGCSTLTCKLSHSLSRTVSNLTDDSLYVESGDEVDSGNIEKVINCDELEVNDEETKSGRTGLLINDERKLIRKGQPPKKVQFSTVPPKVHLMRVWAFAARQARAGHWERYALDRERFKRRIADVDMAVSWVLKPQHRNRIMFQRFRPWWNALRRKEIAEKQEALRKEEEAKIKEVIEAEASANNKENNDLPKTEVQAEIVLISNEITEKQEALTKEVSRKEKNEITVQELTEARRKEQDKAIIEEVTGNDKELNDISKIELKQENSLKNNEILETKGLNVVKEIKSKTEETVTDKKEKSEKTQEIFNNLQAIEERVARRHQEESRMNEFYSGNINVLEDNNKIDHNTRQEENLQ